MTVLTKEDYLPEQEVWEEGVYMLKETDPVLGGISGIDNLPLKHLANRTRYLKKQMEKGEEKRELAFKELVKPDGYKLVGRCKSIAELRTIRPTEHGQRILVDSYYEGGTTGGGEFVADLQDMITPDDGGVCIVLDGNGGRWKRLSDTLHVDDFGIKHQGVDVTFGIQTALNTAARLGKQLEFGFNQTYSISFINIPENSQLKTNGAVFRKNKTGHIVAVGIYSNVVIDRLHVKTQKIIVS